MARVVKTQPRKWGTPIFQDTLEATIAQGIRGKVVGDKGNANSIDRRIHHQWLVRQG